MCLGITHSRLRIICAGDWACEPCRSQVTYYHSSPKWAELSAKNPNKPHKKPCFSHIRWSIHVYSLWYSFLVEVNKLSNGPGLFRPCVQETLLVDLNATPYGVLGIESWLAACKASALLVEGAFALYTSHLDSPHMVLWALLGMIFENKVTHKHWAPRVCPQNKRCKGREREVRVQEKKKASVDWKSKKTSRRANETNV